MNYSLSKVSGYSSFSTTFYIVGISKLEANGIDVLLSNQFSNPPFTGTMHIFVSQTAPLGVYNITLGGNSTNETVRSATFVLDVRSSSPQTTSTSVGDTTTFVTSASTTSIPQTSTAQATTASASTTTIKYTTTSSNSPYYVIVLVVIIILIIIVAATMMKGGKKEQTHQHKDAASKEIKKE